TASSFTYTEPNVAGNLNLAASGGGAQVVNSVTVSPALGLTESGNTVTVTTNLPHGFVVGAKVTISGASNPGYNGTFTILSAPTATTFTLFNPNSGLAASGGGTVVPVAPPSTAAIASTANAVTESGTTVTITTTAPHTFTVGDTVAI